MYWNKADFLFPDILKKCNFESDLIIEMLANRFIIRNKCFSTKIK